MIRLTGLWESTTKSGEFMLSGSLGGAKLIVLRNNRRTGDKSPTHTLLITEREDRVSDVTRQGQGGGQTGETEPEPPRTPMTTYRFSHAHVEARALSLPC